jgi:hypothetical protein
VNDSDCIYIDLEAVHRECGGPVSLAFILALDILCVSWCRDYLPFDYDQAVTKVDDVFTGRAPSAARDPAMRPSVVRFFTQLADGRYVPSPAFFSLTGNLDREMQ